MTIGTAQLNDFQVFISNLSVKQIYCCPVLFLLSDVVDPPVVGQVMGTVTSEECSTTPAELLAVIL